MVSNIDSNDIGWQAAGSGGWNDPDMLEIGNGGMTTDEYVTHMSLWSLAKAPLLIGCDVTTISSETLNILMNKNVIAVNQDPLGVQGHKVSNVSGMDVWAGPLSSSSSGNLRWVVVLVNRNPIGSGPAPISFKFIDIGAPASGNFFSHDLWTEEDAGPFAFQYPAVILSPHQSKMFTLTHTPTALPELPRIILTEQ